MPMLLLFFPSPLTQQMRKLEIAIPVHGMTDGGGIGLASCFASVHLPLPLGPTAENTEKLSLILFWSQPFHMDPWGREGGEGGTKMMVTTEITASFLCLPYFYSCPLLHAAGYTILKLNGIGMLHCIA